MKLPTAVTFWSAFTLPPPQGTQVMKGTEENGNTESQNKINMKSYFNRKNIQGTRNAV